LRGVRAFLRQNPLSVSAYNSPLVMENIVIGLIALGCLVYLVVAVLRPEKF
jgi:K+-transporting ATPase KdpF subunit